MSAGSWPVEVGWAYVEGEADAYLIRPAEQWSVTVWDENAEALHGLSIDRLNREGLQPGDVCDHLCAALEGFEVYSDAPDWDEYWMMRLFDAAGRKGALKLFDFALLMPRMQPSEKEKLLSRAELSGARRHRAADDALYLQSLYRLTHPAG
ncbi:MAG: hypothetical protein KDA46_03905 [Parvularculaceae bacterium]|nr:hypothetical protein [Parvularculaceae bacterium]